MIFRLPTLYKRDTTGKIREWTIEWTGGGVAPAATRTVAGIKDGNLDILWRKRGSGQQHDTVVRSV